MGHFHHNPGPEIQYMAGVAIPAGETREIPQRPAPTPRTAEPEPERPDVDYHALSRLPAAALIPMLPEIELSGLVILSRLEEERRRPRASVLDALSAESLIRSAKEDTK